MAVATRPVMKEKHQSLEELSRRVDDALRVQAAENKAELEYANETNYFEPKDGAGLKADVIKRVGVATQPTEKSWEEKGAQWQKERDERMKAEAKREKELDKKTNKWLKDLESEFEGGDDDGVQE